MDAKPAFVWLLTATLMAGCAPSTPPTMSEAPTTYSGRVDRLEDRTLRGFPIKITRISIPRQAVGLYDAQIANGALWTLAGTFGRNSTVRIDTKSYEVVKLARPSGTSDLLIGDGSLWFSDAISRFAGSGDLYRVDLQTNKIIATISGAGSPFAIFDGTVWTYNWRTRVVSGIDIQANHVHTKVITQANGLFSFFAFGDGSIWQFSTAHSPMQVAAHSAAPAVVRRIDPQSGKTLATMPVGNYYAPTGIYFIAGSLWILGARDDHVLATRIDAKTSLEALIAIPSEVAIPKSGMDVVSFTAVSWNSEIWVSLDVRRPKVPDDPSARSFLMRIDPQTNSVVDAINIGLPRTLARSDYRLKLAAGEGSLWVAIGASVIRFDF